jgi:hypothetical protein
MIKCEVIKKFTLKKFEKLKDVEKVGNRSKDEFDVKDTFKCDKKMADYLTGGNPFNETVIKVLEVEPEKETLAEKIASADKIEVRIIDESTGKIYEQKPVKKKKHSKE